MVKGDGLKIIWGKRAYQSLENAYQYIKEDSPSNAERVRNDILSITRRLADHPKKYPADKFKKNNQSGEYRAFEKYAYRISYRCTKKVIKIVRLRHVKQSPKSY